MVGLDLGEMSHQGDYEWLRYRLVVADQHRPVRACDRARSSTSIAMAAPPHPMLYCGTRPGARMTAINAQTRRADGMTSE
jgi:hypothetical protein